MRGVAASVYAVVRQASEMTQGLVTAKARLAKQGRQYRDSRATYLVDNVRCVLEGFPVASVRCWLDSTVALHWIRGGGEYRQFVANRVGKIRACATDEWRHLPTDQTRRTSGVVAGQLTLTSGGTDRSGYSVATRGRPTLLRSPVMSPRTSLK